MISPKDKYFSFLIKELFEPSGKSILFEFKDGNILFDDNQRFPIVRLHFNNPDHLRVEFYDEITLTSNGGKKGEKVDIKNVSELYNYKERILNVVSEYLGMND